MDAVDTDHVEEVWFARSVLTEFSDNDAVEREMSRVRWQEAFPESDWTNKSEDWQHVTNHRAMTLAKHAQAKIDKHHTIHCLKIISLACDRAYDDWEVGGIPCHPHERCIAIQFHLAVS